MKVLSLFSGIGAFEKALKNLEIPFELVGFSEIDKYAVKSYCAIHGVSEEMNFGDITKIDTDTLPADIDLITYGFPCQDISIAGKQKGLINEDGTQTRSGLFFEALRIIEDTKPKIAIAENVKNLVGKKFNAQFQAVLTSLEEAGYNNYWKVLNAKDFGIPQNRERVFIVSIRKDIDTGDFKFPEGFPLELRLKDMLEDEVDEKYYLDGKFESITKINENYSIMNGGIIGKMHDISRRAYSENATAPTIPTCAGGNIQPKVIVDKNPSIQCIDIPQTVKVRKYPVDTESLCETLRHHKALLYLTNNDISKNLNVPVTKVEHWFRKDDCFAIPDPEIWNGLKALLQIETDEFDKSIMTFEEKEGVFEKSERHYFSEGIAPTLTSTTAAEKVIEPSLKIRKLTPKECFRLMGFTDEDFIAAKVGSRETAVKLLEKYPKHEGKRLMTEAYRISKMSNTQLYKQAGNSIVVDVIVHIFTNIFKNERTEKEMELEIYSPADDGFVKSIEWNHEAIKAEITEKVKYYTSLVYGDEQIREAKADRAKLNKFVQALEAKRKEIKKQCLAPYEAFEKQMKEITDIVKEPIQLIDTRIKSYEEEKRIEKRLTIDCYFLGANPFEWLKIEQIFNEKWLNATVSLEAVKKEIEERIEQIEKDLETLEKMPEFAFEAIESYKTTLDINKAISEGHRLAEIQRRKAEFEKKFVNEEKTDLNEVSEIGEYIPEKAENKPKPITVEKSWISFKALLSVEDATALNLFFKNRNIEFEAI